MGSLSYVSKPSSWLLVLTSMDLLNLALLAAIAFCEVYSNFDNICYSYFKDNVVAHLTSSIIAVCIFSFLTVIFWVGNISIHVLTFPIASFFFWELLYFVKISVDSYHVPTVCTDYLTIFQQTVESVTVEAIFPLKASLRHYCLCRAVCTQIQRFPANSRVCHGRSDFPIKS